MSGFKVEIKTFCKISATLPTRHVRLRAHHPFLGDNDGHPVGISLFENDLAVLKLEDDSALNCRRKRIWPACLPSMVRIVDSLRCALT